VPLDAITVLPDPRASAAFVEKRHTAGGPLWSSDPVSGAANFARCLRDWDLATSRDV
jgi:hypothetical protein